MEGRLVLSSGTVFSGKAENRYVSKGEVVFITGMCGYVESVTDPSFREQILVFTYPLIGNYGVPSEEYFESKEITVAGVIVSQLCSRPSHSSSKQTFLNWLTENEIPVLSHIDTRALAQFIRDKGSSYGVIEVGEPPLKRVLLQQESDKIKPLENQSLPIVYGEGNKVKIIVVDCGIKESLLKNLLSLPIEIKRVSYNYDYSGEDFHGVFLSNGPGDPKDYVITVEILKKILKTKKTVFGVCLGHQLLSLAIGADTYKLKFGHRGQNQPCFCTESKRCYLTSQNHSYAIKGESLPKDWNVWFYNLNDNTVEGILHTELPFFSVQFHPEGSPGPTDTLWIFKRFYECLTQV